MEEKLPYYMVYPMEFFREEDQRERRDYEYLKNMYPEAAKELLPYVEEECDRMEYAGSVIFDEYPDALQIRMMCSRIYKHFQGKKRETDSEKNPETEHLRDFIHILVSQELWRRRENDRRRRRTFY